MLAAMLLAPKVIDVLTGILEAGDFYLEKHRMIYRAATALTEKGTEIDLRTLQAILEDRGEFEAIGGFAYLAGLDLDLPDLSRVETYAGIVKDRAVRRRLIAELGKVVAGCYEHGADDAVAAAEKAVIELGSAAARRDFASLEKVHQDTYELMAERSSGQLIGVSTGFTKWDYLTSGLCPGQLIVLAGRPGMGKTSMMLDVARHAALREGRTVGIFSMEMSASELDQRIIAAETGIDHGALRAGRLTTPMWTQVRETMLASGASPLEIDDSPRPTLEEIAAKARRLRARRGLDLLCVDYFSLMAGNDPRNKEAQLSILSRGFKQLARFLNIPILLLQQLNRDPEKRAGDHRPRLSDLRDTGSLEQDADQVVLMYRDEIYNKDDPANKGTAEAILAKHRNGEIGTIELVFQAELMSYRNPYPRLAA